LFIIWFNFLHYVYKSNRIPLNFKMKSCESSEICFFPQNAENLAAKCGEV